jgi:coxsackievirus/adenovirus receptor
VYLQRLCNEGAKQYVLYVHSYVEFHYNLENGPVVITSLDRVQMKKFHRVLVKCYHRGGMLKLGDYEDVAG